jgi:hypothetical protein
MHLDGVEPEEETVERTVVERPAIEEFPDP